MAVAQKGQKPQSYKGDQEYASQILVLRRPGHVQMPAVDLVGARPKTKTILSEPEMPVSEVLRKSCKSCPTHSLLYSEIPLVRVRVVILEYVPPWAWQFARSDVNVNDGCMQFENSGGLQGQFSEGICCFRAIFLKHSLGLRVFCVM